MEESATAIGREMTAARARLSQLLAALSVEERAEMRRAALNGNRGYDGLVYSGEVMPHAEADDARSVLAEGARSLGLLAARAIAMEESGDMEPKWSVTTGCLSACFLNARVLVDWCS